MSKQFVIEAIMLAIYGELMAPSQPVEYFIPSSTIYELDEFYHSPEPIMPDPDDDMHVRKVMREMSQFFADPFNRKRLEKGLIAPWSCIPFTFPGGVTIQVVKVEDTAFWGELFDPVETQILLTGMHFDIPVITDQPDYQDRILEYVVPVQFYDIDDFEFALEQGISLKELREP
ncbi:ADP-heptose synthase [Brevibacillus composti]|uniref:ADP-heptose synthase n=1 Tax=Brevibacillus composti TaxID=2796470 RepID=A0A7T5EN88_9BACL|nr:ADP-heptose synthase [Brevibacillus composti]QQE75666.1 ADP-heptose synthase [Brevibacillus composti]QUO42692.1 ADP-heptose synthase [Brevibacillus composti]